MLRFTGCASYGEFVAETDPLDRLLTIRSIEQWHNERDGGGGGGGGAIGGGGMSPPGPGGSVSGTGPPGH